jgi:transcriptional regulator with XRE-family HTH domain
MQGLTQQQLGKKIGIGFRQTQKYEAGTSRISASRIWDIAAALEVPETFFFEGLEAYLNDRLWYFANQVAPAA